LGQAVADFDTERAAFFAGFGDGAALLAGLRSTELVVPLDVDGEVFTWMWGDLPWLTAFTDVNRCAAFAEAAGRDLNAVEICVVAGSAVLDELLDRAPTPTGLVIDAASADVMVFPPVRSLTPHCYIDDQSGEVVMS
jgi:hypothetical protein